LTAPHVEGDPGIEHLGLCQGEARAGQHRLGPAAAEAGHAIGDRHSCHRHQVELGETGQEQVEDTLASGHCDGAVGDAEAGEHPAETDAIGIPQHRIVVGGVALEPGDPARHDQPFPARVRVRFVAEAAKHDECRPVQCGLEPAPVRIVPQGRGHAMAVVGDHAVGGNDGMAYDIDAHRWGSVQVPFNAMLAQHRSGKLHSIVRRFATKTSFLAATSTAGSPAMLIHTIKGNAIVQMISKAAVLAAMLAASAMPALAQDASSSAMPAGAAAGAAGGAVSSSAEPAAPVAPPAPPMVTVPTITLVGSSMSEADFRDILTNGKLSDHAKEVAALNATNVTIPSIKVSFTTTATPDMPALDTDFELKDVALNDVKDGVASSASIGGI